MSKNVTIQENGVGYEFALDVLRVPAHGGGSVDLVPADGKNLVKLVVRQNGTYRASDFNAYGIAEVKVACTRSGGNATATAVERAVKGAFNPSIAEGGLSRAFSAELIGTPLTAGGDCQWVPKDAVKLGAKSINVDNRTYKASDDGYFGYSEVTVSGISITKTTDAGGNEVVTHTDGAGTVVEVVPSSIKINPVPRFTGPYNDGQQISFDGMTVKAYKGDGTLWIDANHPGGVISRNELIYPVTVANSSMEKEYDSAKSSFDLSPLPNPIEYVSAFKNPFEYASPPNYYVGYYEFTPLPGKTVRMFAFKLSKTSDTTRTFFASKQSGEIGMLHYYRERTSPTPAVMNDETSFISTSKSYTYAGKTVYYFDGTNTVIAPGNVPVYVWPVSSGVDRGQLAWTLIYGTVRTGGYWVPVQWVRPGDNELLDDAFTITINQ